jgi:hypothetical protein
LRDKAAKQAIFRKARPPNLQRDGVILIKALLRDQGAKQAILGKVRLPNLQVDGAVFMTEG